MDVMGLNWILDGVKDFIARSHARKEQMNRERREAIAILIRALNETRIYFGNLRTEKPDREKEQNLSRIWVTAYEKLLPFDDNLANRCYAKGSYWADPHGWNEEDLLTAGLSIADMEKQLKALIKKGRTTF